MKENPIKIFYLDDNQVCRLVFKKKLTSGALKSQFQVQVFQSWRKLLKNLKTNTPDLLLLDIDLGQNNPSGIELTMKIRKLFPELIIILYTSYEDQDLIIAGHQAGCDQFLNKLNHSDELPKRLLSTYRIAKAKRDHELTPSSQSKLSLMGVPTIVGQTLIEITHELSGLCDKKVQGIHIQGEIGTGKSLAVHAFKSFLPDGTPWVEVNCETLPPGGFDRLFFGVQKSASKPAEDGILEQAQNGFLYLKSIEYLSKVAQFKLLKIIQDKEFRKIGGVIPKPLEFRLITSSRKNMDELLRQGTLQDGLWKLLSPGLVEIKPLRRRSPDEIKELLDYFCKRLDNGPYLLSPELVKVLCYYDWQEGNVREMQQTLESSVKFCKEDKTLTTQELPPAIWSKLEPSGKLLPLFTQESIYSPSTGMRLSPQNPFEIIIDISDTLDFHELCMRLFASLVEVLRGQKNRRKLTHREIAQTLKIAPNTVTKFMRILNEEIEPEEDLRNTL